MKLNCIKCDSENNIIVKYPIANGGIQYRYQCMDCGYLDGRSIAYSEVEDKDNVPLVNEQLREKFYESQRNKINREIAEKQKKIDEEIAEKRKDYMEELKKYYDTPQWQMKRKKRLELNQILFDGLCERCGINKATEVHHRSYAIIDGYEHPFDLECICHDCHKRIHPHLEEI